MVDAVNLSRESVEQLADALGRTLRSGSGASTAPSAGINVGGANIMAGVGAASEGLIKSLSTVTTGNTNLSGILEFATGRIKDFGAVGSVVGNTLQLLGVGILDLNEKNKLQSKYGVTFNQNLLDMAGGAMKSYESLDQFTQRIVEAGNTITTLGSSMNSAVTMYVNLSNKLQDTDIARHLKAAGVASEELNDTLMMVASTRKLTVLREEADQTRLAEAAASLENEFNNVAKITGISRQQQQKDLDKTLHKADIDAALMMATEDQARAVTNASAKMGQVPELQKLFAELFAKEGNIGALPQELKETFVAIQNMAPQAAADLTKAVDLAMSKNAEDNAKVPAMIEQTLRDVGEAYKDPRNLELIRRLSDISPLIQKMGEIGRGGAFAVAGRGQQEAIEAMAAGKTVEDLRKQKELDEEQRRKGNLPTGEKDPGAALAQSINKGQDFIKSLGSLIPEINAVGAAYKSAGNLAKNINEMDISINKLRSSEAFTFLQTATTKAADAMGSVTEGLGHMGEKIQEYFYMVLPKPGEEGKGTPESRQTGSLGMTGKYIEDFGKGTLAMLHGNEGVITEGQLKQMQFDLVETLMASASKQASDTASSTADIFNNAITTLTQPSETTTTTNVNPNESIMKDIKDELVMLNTNIKELINHTADVADTSKQQVRVTKGLSNDRLTI